MKKEKQHVKFIDEDGEERSAKRKKKSKQKDIGAKGGNPSGIKHFIATYNARSTKGNFKNTALKTAVDLAAIGLGTAISATTGKTAPLVAAALIGTGHYVGDESGFMRLVGASAFAHSVAKAKEYRDHPEMTVIDRLKDVKDCWLHATLLKHYESVAVKQEKTIQIQPELSEEESASVIGSFSPDSDGFPSEDHDALKEYMDQVRSTNQNRRTTNEESPRSGNSLLTQEEIDQLLDFDNGLPDMSLL